MNIGKIWKTQLLVIAGVGGLVGIEVLVTSIDISVWSPSLRTLVETVIHIVFSCGIIIGIFQYLDQDSVVRKYIRYKRWDSFGNRMKVAYEAKFGYSNSAFDKEVDQHVLAMKSLGKGYTKTVDKQWMKRMAKFVEVPFVIPEEERLSEEDKTRSFSKI
jgi:hypothetical protein